MTCISILTLYLAMGVQLSAALGENSSVAFNFFTKSDSPLESSPFSHGMIDLYEYVTNSHADSIDRNCVAYIEKFSNSSSRFIKCAVKFSRPFRFCNSCVEFYEETITVFSQIQKDDAKMSNCRALLNADRVQVISTIYNNIQGIWQQADCSGCFQSITENNGTVKAVTAQSYQEFLNYYRNFTLCVYGKNSSTHHKPHHNATLCHNCQAYYSDMNSLFNNLLQGYSQRVCMDIVDMMNYTRQTWGQELNCTRYQEDVAPIVCITLGVCLLPVAFYVATKIYGSQSEKKLMKQKRMSVVQKMEPYCDSQGDDPDDSTDAIMARQSALMSPRSPVS